MSAQFQYSLLQYHHLGREEWLTVGVLVFFAQQKRVKFLYPEKVSRLRYAFPDAPEKLLKSWLKSFDWRAEDLNAKPDIFARYNLENDGNRLVAEHFLPLDSSALQFRDVRSAVQYSDDTSLICDHLIKKYLSVYQHDEDEYGQKDNAWLVNQYRKFLRERKSEVLVKKIIKENVPVHFRHRDYKFDFSWQNHTFNLVKAVSLDLKRPDSIQRKAEQYFGQFSLLKDYASENNARFDVLLARPTDRKLYAAYDKAVEDINQAGNVNVVQPEKISSYAEQTIAELVFPNEEQ